MADNIVKRIIALVLNKDSATKTQKEIDQFGAGVEKTWKDTAARIAGYLGVAFLTKKVIDFGKAAVREAASAQAAWANLKGTIDGTGESFDKLADQIHATADAFQDATIHDDDEFAQGLARVISLTGDVNASLNNMGLIANVAAQFFNGELEPATNLVAKAMNGNTAALQKMGIHAKTAQEALDILSKRSLGAAAREAQTFTGQTKQLENAWNDMLKLLGNAIIKSDGTSSALTVLRNVVQHLTDWIDENQDAIAHWVTEGVNFAIDAADVFIRAVDGMARILSGGLVTSLGLAAQGLALLVRGMAALQRSNIANPSWWTNLIEAKRKLFGQVSETSVREEMNAGTQVLEHQADALDAWGESMRALGTQQVQAGISVLSTPLFSSKDFQGPSGRKKKTPGEENAPLLAAGTLTPEQENIQKAMEEFGKAGLRISAMKKALGDDFDEIGAEIDRTTKLLEVLAENAGDTTDIEHLQNQLRLLKDATTPANMALKELSDTMNEDMQLAAINGATSLERLQSEQKALETAIRKLITAGIAPEDERLKRLTERYKKTTDAIKEQTAAMEVQAAAADFLAEAMGAALEGGLGAAASKKAKQNAIEAAEMLVRAGAFALFGDFAHASGALVLAAQYGAVAAAWGALALSSHKGGGGGATTVPTAGSGGSSGATEVTNARRSSERSSATASQPSAEVSIYMVGPGFDAVNPTVQRVVWGASQQAAERYGPNARVRVVPRGE